MNRKKQQHKINNQITSQQVRIVVDGESKVMSTYEAIRLANSSGMDLILINENQNPPIAKIDDYGKFIYNQEKALKERKKNSVKNELKEIQLSQDIALHDMQTKARKSREFLKEGNSVRCLITLKGRQKANPERAELVMLKFAEMLTEDGVLESMPKLDGSKWFMTMKPKK